MGGKACSMIGLEASFALGIKLMWKIHFPGDQPLERNRALFSSNSINFVAPPATPI